MNQIKFATFNVGGGVPYRKMPEFQEAWFNAADYMGKLIADQGLDIVCFQEVLTGDETYSSMCSEIGRKSGLKYYMEWMLSDSHIVTGRKMGVAIASKFPITESRRFRLENPNIVHRLDSGEIYRSHEKGFLIVEIRTDAGRICCVSGQCIPFHTFCRDAAEFRYIYSELERMLLKLAEDNRHVIIGADLNVSREELRLFMPELMQRYSCLPGRNMATRPNGRGDDYILYKADKGQVEFRLVKTCFDHYGCVGTFRKEYFTKNEELEKMGWEETGEKMAVEQRKGSHVYVLHLSDLHFSGESSNDMDKKIPAKLDSNLGKEEWLENYIQDLPTKPDYVVVSGDITVRGSAAGFEKFHQVMIRLIGKGKLPSANKFIIVPGNHDVTAASSVKDKNRWVNFKSIIGNTYMTPWIVNGDYDYGAMKRWVDAAMEAAGPLQGGNMINPETRAHISVPFLVDKENKILFYAFNSAFPSQIEIDNKEVKGIIDHYKKYGEDDKEFSFLVQAMEKRMKIDPARIIDEEIWLFIYCMKKLKHKLMLEQEAGGEYTDYIKIAVLHHHITSIACSEEIKEFELLTNAGKFKKILADYGFHMVLHGHKHWNEVYKDTAVSGGSSLAETNDGRALLGISGGTICGTPCNGKSAGFYWLDFSMDRKTVKPYYHEVLSYDRDNVKEGREYYLAGTGEKCASNDAGRGRAAGGAGSAAASASGCRAITGDNAIIHGEKKYKTKQTPFYKGNNEKPDTEDYVGGAERGYSYDWAGRNSAGEETQKTYKPKELYSRMEKALMDNIHYNKEGDKKSFGWGRLLIMKKPNRISMMATAYGLIIADMLNIHTISYMAKKKDIINTLWNFRLEEGGFKASSQAGEASIEATVCALRAFYRVRDMEKFEITLEDLNSLIEKEKLNEESSITTLTLALDVLCECCPNHEKVGGLKDIIIQKAYVGRDGRPLYWAESVAEEEEGASICTALAVIALLNYAKSSNGWKQMVAYLHNCGEWLLRTKWKNWEETISHKSGGPLTYYHYTAFWGIIALLRLGYGSDEKRIKDEMQGILEKETDGVWAWDKGLDYPIWTIYNAILMMNEYVLNEIRI